MKYEIRATKRFERDFRRLTKEMKVRIDSAIRGLQENPYLGKFLHGDLKGKRSLRISDLFRRLSELIGDITYDEKTERNSERWLLGNPSLVVESS